MKKITFIILTLPLSLSAFAIDIFPKENKFCTETKGPCSNDEKSTCIKTVCYYNKDQLTLDLFANKHNIIGKKLDNLLEFKTYILANMPNELKKYSIHFVSEKTVLTNYEFSILFIINKNNFITSVQLL